MLLVLTAVGSTLVGATGEQLFGEPKPRWLFPESDARWLQSSAVLGDIVVIMRKAECISEHEIGLQLKLFSRADGRELVAFG